GETGQASLRLGTAPGGAFVANLATRAGGGTGERRNGRRVVVSFHLHQDMDGFLIGGVLAGLRVRIETPGGVADDYGGVVLVRGQHTLAVHLEGVLNHAEQGLFLTFAVDVPAGI